MTYDDIDALCRGLPGVTTDIKWGNDRVYSIGEKMFLVMREQGRDEGGLSFKVAPERFLELTDRPGISPAPYLAKHHWVLLASPAALPGNELAALLRASYDLVLARLPKRFQASLRQ